MWDSVFALMFARHGRRAFDFQRTLDTFYRKQHADGFISREIQESDGHDRFHRADLPSTGPNVLAWSEWEHFEVNGDLGRLRRVFPQIGDTVKFDYVWWGHLAGTADKRPHVYDLAPGVLAWNGCNGRGVGLATALGQELAKASAGVPLREIAAPVETRLNTILGHEFKALGVAWTIAQNRLKDRRD